MTNAEIAAVFREIAALLEIDGADTFRVRSYQRVADSLESLGENVADIYARGELQKIPGVGKSTAKKISELLDTGVVAAHQELRAKFPETLLEMLSISGFGPRKVALVYNELGIKSVEELEEAAEEGRLRELQGFGAKSEENLLRSIALYRQGQKRTLLGSALPRAQELVKLLQARDDVLQVSIAGSLRRGRETIGDMDILATSTDAAGVCEFFAGLPQFSEVIAHGETKVSARFEDNLQVDLRAVEPESFGAALQYFTGSQAHNIELRERAQKRDLTINEYGVFRVMEQDERGEKVAGETEEGVYEAVGLPWIPPELREARGEIEAAEAGRLPELITLDDIRGDCQMHSEWSDGHTSIAEMATACRERGYEYCVITDHSVSLGVAGGLTPEQVQAEAAEIAELNEKLRAEGIDFRVFHGTEVDILADGSLDYDDDVLAAVDFVIVAIHQGFSRDEQRIMKRLRAALENPHVDCVAHPTGRLINTREAYAVNLAELIDLAAEHDVALEINAFPERLDLDDVHCRLARDRGVDIMINTDAHDPAHLDYMQFGVTTARRGWLEAKDVVNTRSAGEFEQWLHRK